MSVCMYYVRVSLTVTGVCPRVYILTPTTFSAGVEIVCLNIDTQSFMLDAAVNMILLEQAIEPL